MQEITWRDYWRTPREKPKDKMHVIVQIDCGLRHAVYKEDTDVYISAYKDKMGRKPPIENVRRWCPFPFKDSPTESEIPIEVVFAHMYDQYKNVTKRVRHYARYIKAVHRYLLELNISQEVREKIENTPLNWGLLDELKTLY